MRTRTLGCLACLLAATGFVGAEPYSASTKEQLISLLKAHNGESSTVIELAAGDYYLTDEEAWDTASSTGTNHLYAKSLRIKGMGTRPEDTRLIGSGNLRVIRMESNATIENLTITNGHAQTVSGKDNSNRGGGIYGGNATNCLVIGNRAEGYGGGGAGSVHFYDCRIIANHSKFGGGFHGSYAYSCRIADNRAYSNGGGLFTAYVLKDSLVENNAVTNSGGGGGCWFCTYGTNNIIRGNVATDSGGGVAGNSGTGCIVDCIVSNNTASTGAGVYSITVSNSTVALNNASNAGGGIYNCRVFGSTIYGNVATRYGGGAAGGATDGSACGVTDCIISNNFSDAGGGAYQVAVTNCTVVMNHAIGSGGGVGGGMVYDSWIAFNTSGGDGGGGISSASIVSNCTVYGNLSSNRANNCFGAGIKGTSAAKTHVYDTEIYGNAALDQKVDGTTRLGCTGGIINSTLYNCDVHDNFAHSYGGGVRSSVAYDCRIWNNICYNYGPNSMGSTLVRCDVSGTPIYGGTALNTVIRDIGPGAVSLVGNPLISTNFTPSSGWHGYPNGTNCLIVNVQVPNNVLFSGVLSNPSDSSTLVNCTVVGCTFRRVFACYAVAEKPMNVLNCIFYGNRQYTTAADYQNGTGIDCDLSIDAGNVNSSALHFSRTAYGASAISSFADCVEDEVYKIGAADGVGTVVGRTPGFCGAAKDPAHPYALRHSSVLRARGAVQGWMADANDLRGEGYPRLRDGRVDLGCYQCWLQPVGMKIDFK